MGALLTKIGNNGFLYFADPHALALWLLPQLPFSLTCSHLYSCRHTPLCLCPTCNLFPSLTSVSHSNSQTHSSHLPTHAPFCVCALPATSFLRSPSLLHTTIHKYSPLGCLQMHPSVFVPFLQSLADQVAALFLTLSCTLVACRHTLCVCAELISFPLSFTHLCFSLQFTTLSSLACRPTPLCLCPTFNRWQTK